MKVGDAFGLGITIGVVVGVLLAGAIDGFWRDSHKPKPVRSVQWVQSAHVREGDTVWNAGTGWSKVTKVDASFTWENDRIGIICELEKVE